MTTALSVEPASDLLDPSAVAASVHGDVASLQAWALRLAQLGSSGFGDVATRLDAARGVLTSWQGPASTAATDRLLATDHVWTDHGQQFGSLAQTVYWYAQVVAQAKTMAGQAADLTAQGNTEHDRWLVQYQLTAAYGGTFVPDPAPPFWNAAENLLVQARQRVTAAEQVVIAALRQTTAAAPTNPGIMADPWAATGRAWNTIKQSAVGLTESANVIDPSRHWLDTTGHNKDLTAIGTGLANGVDHAAQHPGDTALNTWDQLSRDPAATTGSAAFAATTALAGGVGTGLLKKGLTATGTALTSTARGAVTDLGAWLRNSNLDLHTLSAQKKLGLLGLMPQTQTWAIPPGPSAPWKNLGRGTLLIDGASASYTYPMVQAAGKAGWTGDVLGLVRKMPEHPIEGINYQLYPDPALAARSITPEFLLDHNVQTIIPLSNVIKHDNGPTGVLDVNVGNRYHLVDVANQAAAASGQGIRMPIFSSHSVWTTGDHLTELDPMTAVSPYGITTGMSEQLQRAAQGNVIVPVVRIPTTVGWAPQLRPDGMIQPHTWAEDLAKNGHFVVNDFPGAYRPYGDNNDIANQIMRVTLADPARANDLYVLGRLNGTGGVMTQAQMAGLVQRAAADHGFPVNFSFAENPSPVGGLRQFSVDNSKYMNAFGGPDVPVDGALYDVVGHYLSQYGRIK